jgi:hypothetical protein
MRMLVGSTLGSISIRELQRRFNHALCRTAGKVPKKEMSAQNRRMQMLSVADDCRKIQRRMKGVHKSCLLSVPRQSK